MAFVWGLSTARNCEKDRDSDSCNGDNELKWKQLLRAFENAAADLRISAPNLMFN